MPAQGRGLYGIIWQFGLTREFVCSAGIAGVGKQLIAINVKLYLMHESSMDGYLLLLVSGCETLLDTRP